MNFFSKHIEYVYVLSNPSFKEDILKVGMTTRTVEQRVSELNSPSSLPLPFKIERKYKTKFAQALERHIHNELRIFRVNSYREFFNVTLDQVDSIVSELDEDFIRTLELEKDFSELPIPIF